MTKKHMLGVLCVLLLAAVHGAAAQAALDEDPYPVLVNIHVAPDYILQGEQATITVTVVVSGTALIPTGQVEIKSGVGVVCELALDALGQGACTQTFVKAGKLPLKATYLGDTPFLPGVSDVAYLFVQTENPVVEVYRHDFETTVGNEWCLTRQESAPLGRGFLGRFGNETACLVLDRLPAHKLVQVSYDLYIIQSWNGSVDFGPGKLEQSPELDEPLGPDYFTFQLDSVTWLDTTFSNWPDALQAFPDFAGVELYPGQTGASEVDSLGYLWNGEPRDSVYHFNLYLPHTASTLRLDFTGRGLQTLDNESWGLDNLVVTTIQEFRMYAPLVVQ